MAWAGCGFQLPTAQAEELDQVPLDEVLAGGKMKALFKDL